MIIPAWILLATLRPLFLFSEKMEAKIQLKYIQLFRSYDMDDYRKSIDQQFKIDIDAYADFETTVKTDKIDKPIYHIIDKFKMKSMQNG